MRLLITTPLSIVVDTEDVCHVRAEDETGAFGILPGHGDFVTVLAVSVITWRTLDRKERHAVVRGGVLTVRDGDLVAVATREAIDEETLLDLDEAVLERFRVESGAEEESRTSATRLHLAAIRQLQRYIQAGRQPVPRGSPQALGSALQPGGASGEGGGA